MDNNFSNIIRSFLIDYNSAFESVDIKQITNKSDYDSIVISSDETLYRSKVSGALFARIKKSGKNQYIAFKNKYRYWFDSKNISTFTVKSDALFFRVLLQDFNDMLNSDDCEFGQLAAQICIDAMSFPSFGCCHLYNECSDAGKCLHSDQLYAASCSYRRNLESGRIFYGKNE